jgi:hypothetical protein
METPSTGVALRHYARIGGYRYAVPTVAARWHGDGESASINTGMIAEGREQRCRHRRIPEIPVETKLDDERGKGGLGCWPAPNNAWCTDPKLDPHRAVYLKRRAFVPTVPYVFAYHQACAEIRVERIRNVPRVDIANPAAGDKALKRTEAILVKYAIQQT